MSYILLIIFVATALAVDAYLRRRRVLATVKAMSSDEVLFHRGHGWVRLYGVDDAAVGVSDFAANFVGKLISVELPERGRRLRQGEPAWTLVSEGQRKIQVQMPIDGVVTKLNDAVVHNPEIAQRSPYENGWLLRVRPRKLRPGLQRLLRGTDASTWLNGTHDTVMARLSPDMGALARDGGEWVMGFGEALSADDWKALRNELFPDN